MLIRGALHIPKKPLNLKLFRFLNFNSSTKSTFSKTKIPLGILAHQDHEVNKKKSDYRESANKLAIKMLESFDYRLQ